MQGPRGACGQHHVSWFQQQRRRRPTAPESPLQDSLCALRTQGPPGFIPLPRALFLLRLRFLAVPAHGAVVTDAGPEAGLWEPRHQARPCSQAPGVHVGHGWKVCAH